MPVPIRYDAAALDLSPRVFYSVTVAASPTDGTETIIATITVTGDIAAISAVHLSAWAAYTVGTNGVTANLKIRQTNASGTTKAATGATTVVAANLRDISAHGVDTAPSLPGQVYVATLTVGSASAGSTVSAVMLRAIVV